MITTMHRQVRTLQIVLLVSLIGSAGIATRDRQSAQAARDFSQWEKDVAAFEAADRTNPPPKDATLFVGSSTIVRWTRPELFADDKPSPDHPHLLHPNRNSDSIGPWETAPM